MNLPPFNPCLSASPWIRASLIGVAVLLPGVRAAFYDQHVIFDNALARGPYPHSETYVVAPSTLETRQGNISVVDDRFVSAPSALRIAWKSATGGDWRVTLRTPGTDWRKFVMEGETLAFWCYSEQAISAESSPRIMLFDRNSRTSPPLTLVKGNEVLPARQWTRIRLPLGRDNSLYRETTDDTFKLANTVGVILVQGLDDGKDHVVTLDDLVLLDGAVQDSTPPAAVEAVTVTGYERHCELAWKLSTDPDVLHYRIYRSWNGRDYEPVGTQRADWGRQVDFTGEPGRQVHYKVSAVDLAGNESPLSRDVVAQTRPMDDRELLDMVQLGCFRYYWEAGHPRAGLAPEIVPGDEHLMALGGNGFGVMALLVAAERKFVTREEAAQRLLKILRFLDAADRYHGAWSHYLDGRTAKTVAFFGKYDNGADLVETAFIIQGLLAARQYFDRDTPAETEIRAMSTRFWREVEWDWFRRQADSDVLYWHWSPTYGFHIQHPLIGWNESLIIYLLAIASPTHPVPASMWHSGWAGQSQRHIDYRRGWSRTKEGDRFVNGNLYYGIKLEVGEGNGGELFFTHFSFMGFDPRGLRDRYTNYFTNNRAIALIQHAYARENPRGYVGYGADCWGRSAGVNSGGGRAMPRDDNGTINIMASLASMPYTPDESMAALRHFYRKLGDRTWGPYGFYDGFNETQNRFDKDYMALNQAPIAVMIENHRSGLVWKAFMSNPEIRPALEAIGFRPDP